LVALWGYEYLQQYEHALQTGPLAEPEWVDLPPWLTRPASEPILRQVKDSAHVWATADLLEPGLCRGIGQGLQSSPWVAEVRRVAKQADGRICIHARFREPFALVEVDGQAYLIDRQGVRLPAEYEISSVAERYWNDWLRITGVSGPIPREGEPWIGDDLAAGLKLVEFINAATARGEVPFRALLRAIDVANFKRRADALDGELRIRTIYLDSYVNWGLPPGEEYSMEPPATTKLAMLRTVYADRGQLPENILDVRWFTGIKIGKMKRG
jgi:hypothetical protein